MVNDEAAGIENIALKTLRKEKLSSVREEGLKKEFEILSKLRHPNLEEVYDYGTIEEGPEREIKSFYFTCEYCQGLDLMKSTELWMEFDDVCELIVQLCRALQFIHSHSLIHYDLNELFVRDLPYKGKTSTSVLRAHIEEPIPPIEDKVPELSYEMVDLIRRLMSKNSQERPANANEVIRWVNRIALRLRTRSRATF